MYPVLETKGGGLLYGFRWLAWADLAGTETLVWVWQVPSKRNRSERRKPVDPARDAAAQWCSGRELPHDGLVCAWATGNHFNLVDDCGAGSAPADPFLTRNQCRGGASSRAAVADVQQLHFAGSPKKCSAGPADLTTSTARTIN